MEPCLCGAPDCPRCFPSSWWHLETCEGDDCSCPDPYEDDITEDLYWGDEPYDDSAEKAYEAHIDKVRGYE